MLSIEILKNGSHHYLVSEGNQDVDPGRCHVPPLLGSKVILVSGDVSAQSILCPQVHNGDPAQDGHPPVHCHCLLDQVFHCFHPILHLFSSAEWFCSSSPLSMPWVRLSHSSSDLLWTNVCFSVNPLIYVAMSKLFRNSLLKMMRELCCTIENQVDVNVDRDIRWALMDNHVK